MTNLTNGNIPTLDDVLADGRSKESAENTPLTGMAPAGQLPLTPDMLLNEPSGNLFAMTQNVGMGWDPHELGRRQFLILSTHGGLREADGTPLALGYHTGHWEINLLVRQAAETLRSREAIPFAAYCTDPCDGRTQGTDGMLD